MELPKHLYTDQPLPASPETSMLLVAGSGSAVLVLAAITCVCWGRNSSGLFSSRGDSRRDTVPLDDLLSKPSLADPESVFSEAGSNDFRPLARAGSWFPASGEENSCVHESGSTSGTSQGERDRCSGHVLAALTNGADHNTGLLSKQGNYPNKQLTKTSKSAQQLELEQLQLQNRQNVHNEAASRLHPHRLKPTVECRYLGDKMVHQASAGVQTTSSASRVAGHNGISEKVGLDPTFLKIHRDSVAGQGAPFLSSARCSFSHEVGHVVHGKQTPRPSLPRTEEVDSGNTDTSSAATNEDESLGRTTEQPTAVKHGQSDVLISPDLTVNGQEQVKDETQLVRSEAKDNNRRPSMDHSCVSTQVSQKPGRGLAGSTCPGAPDNRDNTGGISWAKQPLSGGRPASDLDQSQPAAVTMRRCLSCVQGDVGYPEQVTKSGRQTFSLNLKIDVHFDNERGCSPALPTVVCSPLPEYTGTGHYRVTDSCLQHTASDSIKTKNNNNNINVNNINILDGGSVAIDAKERQLETSFADKSQHAKPLIAARKRRSEPTIAEASLVKTFNIRPLSRRLSETESFAPAVSTTVVDTPGNAVRPDYTVRPENAVRRVNAVRPGVAARQATRRNLLAADADTTRECTAADIPGNCYRQEASMATDAGTAGTYPMAAYAPASQEIPLAPAALAGRAAMDSGDQICPTGDTLLTAIRSEGDSEARTVKTEPRAGDETETGDGGPVSDADSLEVKAGRHVRVGNIVISINGRTTGQQPPDWEVAHILTETEALGLSVDSLGGVKAAERNVQRNERSPTSQAKHSKNDHIYEHTHCQEHRGSCDQPAMIGTSVTMANTNLAGEVDQTEAVVSSQSAGENAPSEDARCRYGSSVSKASISADCEKSTESKSDLGTNTTVEFTVSTDIIEGSTETNTDTKLSQECTDATKAGAVEASDGDSLKQTPAAGNASSGYEMHRRALTVKEGHVPAGPQKHGTLAAHFQPSSSLRTLPLEEIVHRSVGASANTKDRRQAVFIHDKKNLSESPTRLCREHTQGQGSENTASVGVAGIQGRATGSRMHAHQPNNTDQTTASEITNKDREVINTDQTTPREVTNKDREVTNTDLTTPREVTNKDREVTNTDLTTPREVTNKDRKVTNTDQITSSEATNTDQITSSEVTNSDCSLEEADLVGITAGRIQQMKQRLAASGFHEHGSIPSRAPRQGRTGDAARTSAPDEGTVHATAPKPAPRRLALNKETRQAAVCETDISGCSVISITVENSADSTETADVSDDSDYDNPWDSLDDAVKRASIRYNRRPSRIAAGDTKTLLLKSAEDLGRLLQEADKRRQLRQTRNSCQLVAPETDSLTIPLTRFSPHRHTANEVMSQTHMSTAHSTENILKTDSPVCPQLSLLRQGHASAAGDHKGLDARRPMSLTSKVRAKITSPETKQRKK
ncbi:hypothetical protein BsWGS_06297 [Bradybaena similaris]